MASQKRKTRVFSQAEVEGLRVCAKILQLTRDNTPNYNSFRGFVSYLLDLTGHKYVYSTIQKNEAAGTEHRQTGRIIDITTNYLQDVQPLTIYSYQDLTELTTGTYKIKQPPISTLIEQKKEELAIAYLGTLYHLEIKESVIDAAKLDGYVSQADLSKVALFLDTTENVVIHSTISQIYKNLGFAVPVADYVPIPEFTDLPDLLNWALDTYGDTNICDVALEIPLNRLYELADGEKPTEEEVIDLAFALRQLTRDKKFTQQYIAKLANHNESASHKAPNGVC